MASVVTAKARPSHRAARAPSCCREVSRTRSPEPPGLSPISVSRTTRPIRAVANAPPSPTVTMTNGMRARLSCRASAREWENGPVAEPGERLLPERPPRRAHRTPRVIGREVPTRRGSGLGHPGHRSGHIAAPTQTQPRGAPPEAPGRPCPQRSTAGVRWSVVRRGAADVRTAPHHTCAAELSGRRRRRCGRHRVRGRRRSRRGRGAPGRRRRRRIAAGHRRTDRVPRSRP